MLCTTFKPLRTFLQVQNNAAVHKCLEETRLKLHLQRAIKGLIHKIHKYSHLFRHGNKLAAVAVTISTVSLNTDGHAMQKLGTPP